MKRDNGKMKNYKTYHSLVLSEVEGSLTRPERSRRITYHSRQWRPGQALVLLLVFIAIATTIIGGAVAITIINSQSTSKFALGEEALAIAESGADNAVLRILRDPNSTYVGETLTVDEGSAQITVSYSLPDVLITSQGEVSNIIRKIEVAGTYQNNRLTVTSWKQVN